MLYSITATSLTPRLHTNSALGAGGRTADKPVISELNCVPQMACGSRLTHRPHFRVHESSLVVKGILSLNLGRCLWQSFAGYVQDTLLFTAEP